MNVEYQRLLKTNEWKEFRCKVLIEKKAYCHQCGNRKKLQVHHLRYYPNTLPWEYNMDDVVLLCDECHTNVHTNGLVLNEEPFKRIPKKKPKKKTTKKETSIKKKTTKPKGDIIQYTLDGRELATTTLEELNNKYGYEKGVILSCCKGRIKSAYGYKWEQIDTNDKPNILNILLENTFEKEKVSKKNKSRNKLIKLSK